jgi:hypothetical protein
LRISGVGVFSQAGDINVSIQAINYPTQSPYLTGSVIVPSTAAQDAIQITGKWQAVQLEDFGIKFASAIAFNNTGHGIRSDPSTTGGHPGAGVFDSSWRNLAVFGHDGNHYAYRLVNAIYNQMDHLRSYGGGCLYLENNSWGNWGDSLYNWLYGQVIAGGTAHGIELNNATTPTNHLDTITFIRRRRRITSRRTAVASSPSGRERRRQPEIWCRCRTQRPTGRIRATVAPPSSSRPSTLPPLLLGCT